MRQSDNRASFLFAPLLALLLSGTLVAAAPPIRSLTFDERVTAQRAIERVYRAHRIGAGSGVHPEIARAVLERKVRTYLERSAALEHRWHTPITAEMLRAEMERIARDTRFPDRLREIYAALDHDAFLVQECFVRPALAARLARGFLRSTPSAGSGSAGPAEDRWAEIARGLDPRAVRTVASEGVPLPEPADLPGGPAKHGTGGGPENGAPALCLPDDTWDNGRLHGPPEARLEHSAVWTGTEMIVWGGLDGIVFRNDGGRYDPLTDTWTPISTAGAPAPRLEHIAVWTGTEMIVWGGNDDYYTYRNDGGRYDPVTDTWLPTSTVGAPTSDAHSTAVWTGSEMIVFGETSGGRYDPATDTWSPNPSGAAGPWHRSFWTGTEVLVIGRSSGKRYDPVTNTSSSISSTNYPHGIDDQWAAVWSGTEVILWTGDDGGRYDPSTDTWTPISAVDAPTTPSYVVGAWAGSRMVVWGGYTCCGSDYTNTGGVYDPATDTWTPTSLVNVSPGRAYHTVVSTGDEMIVWGGRDITEWTNNTGARYDPLTDTWRRTNDWIPAPRTELAGVWTGAELLVWSGSNSRLTTVDTPYDDGARYDPLMDDWTYISTSGAPVPRRGARAVWTGSEMILWGGDDGAALTDTGGRYDPVADSWAPMASLGAPSARRAHAAAWTGTEMIVWGGWDGAQDLDTGGRYDPLLDRWLPTSTVGAPAPRSGFSSAWTGSELILWGGEDAAGQARDDGARYEPTTDTWTPTSTVGAPAPRYRHAGVWVGARMLIFGGVDYQGGYIYFDDGALYDPVGDTWAPVSNLGGPPTSGAGALWNGEVVLFWPIGGSGGYRYDPAADTWSSMTQQGAPDWRSTGIKAWTGSFLAVWGGDRRSVTDTGGRYFAGGYADLDGDGYACDADCDDWNAGLHPGAPEVCDGLDSDCDGVLPPDEADGDADGAPLCADCDDADPARFPANPEICDSVDNDCDLQVDEDDDGDGIAVCLDCDDGDGNTYPGAPETNDARDNQCAGEPGFGLVDEISGTMGFLTPGDPAEICWPAQSGATGYEVLRSRGPEFGTDCVRAATAASCLSDPDGPEIGRTAYYLVRSRLPYAGSAGATASGAERVADCAGGEWLCADGLDDDGDGLIDCDDTVDCLGHGCTAATFAFTDTPADDVASQALAEFLQRVPAAAADWLYFAIGPPGDERQICAQRADFYRDSYLALAGGSGSVDSGGWDKWSRVGGGAWSGPDATGRPNAFGDACAGAWSWCPETGLVGLFPGVFPGESTFCETFDGPACSDGTWTLTVRVGTDRLAACGF